LIDDIVDSGSLSKEEARRMLDFWREEIGRLYRGQPTHSVAAALAVPIARWAIPQEAFLEMIRGCAMDLEGNRYQTIADLESYMRGVASSVGVMCVHIFGWEYTPRDKMMEFAQVFGYAFQLTNIIRDVGLDLELGRIYLPIADLREAGFDENRLMARDHGPAFTQLMDREYRRAKDYYARARSMVDARDLPALLPAEVMAHVYEGLLDDIKKKGFRVLYQKVSLSPQRKLALAFKAWFYCYGHAH
jgi:phytoene synthase